MHGEGHVLGPRFADSRLLIPALIRERVDWRKSIECGDLDLARLRNESLQPGLEIVRHHLVPKEEKAEGRRGFVVSALAAEAPVRIAAVLGAEADAVKLRRGRMDRLGYGRALQFVKTLPDRAQPIARELLDNDRDDVRLFAGRFLPGQRGELLELIRVYGIEPDFQSG